MEDRDAIIILVFYRFGAVDRVLGYCTRGRMFDTHTVQTSVCMNISVCIGSGWSIYNDYIPI
jgi:hypothetical protein